MELTRAGAKLWSSSTGGTLEGGLANHISVVKWFSFATKLFFFFLHHKKIEFLVRGEL